MTAAYVLFLLVVKHAVADLILQSRLTTGDKADLTSPKGYRHALDHALCTLLVCIFFAPIPWALGIAVLDFVLHFIIDFSKTKIVEIKTKALTVPFEVLNVPNWITGFR